MKRQTALKYLQEIARRAHSVNGLLATPLCEKEAVRVSRIWVFGSTAKGSQSPNDLDLLIDMRPVGRHRTWKQAGLDKRYLHSYGIRCAKDSNNEFMKWLTKGMRMVSRHNFYQEGAEIDVKKLIYPRYELELT